MKNYFILRLSFLALLLPCLVLLISVCKPPAVQTMSKKLAPIQARLISNSNDLNTLFAKLKTAKDTYEVQWVQAQIWQIWMSSGETEVDEMMEEGNKAMNDGKYSEAIVLFSKIIRKMPSYAEAWNKRATVYYMKGDYEKSLQDIEQTLSLENRHFGAFSGLASVYIALGEYKYALKALERVLEICPQQPGVREQVYELYQKLNMSKA
jgi:tetratricopeptide (TPR) repeat protein